MFILWDAIRLHLFLLIAPNVIIGNKAIGFGPTSIIQVRTAIINILYIIYCLFNRYCHY